MSILFQDVKLSVRQLWSRPAFTVTAVLTLALGIGVNAVAFTVINGLLFKGPAMKDAGAGRLMTTPGGDEGGHASLAEYERFADGSRESMELAAEGRATVAWKHDGLTDTAWVLFVSSNYFPLVGARAIAGDATVEVGADGVPSVVIGERFWRRNLQSRSLAGLALQLNESSVSVAGVMPESFTGPSGLYSPDIWLPLEAAALFRISPARQTRDERWLFVFGQLRGDATVPEAQSRVEAAAVAMAREWPDTHRGRSARFRLFSEGNAEIRALTTAALVAMGIIGLVLLLACFNVANLLLARAVERERDLAIRAAIGASPVRLIRLVITEGFIIAALAGLAAVMVTRWTATLVRSFAIPIEQPQHIDLAPDGTVVGFVALLVLIAAVLPGVWPALRAARVNVLRVLGSHGSGSAGGRPSAGRRWLVGAQIAGSTSFLAVAALFVQSYGSVSLADMGFDRDRLLVAVFDPASHGYDAQRSERYLDALAARTRVMPGIAEVAAADRVPFFIGYERLTPVSRPNAPCVPEACPKYATMAVGPGYFGTMGIAVTAGREFAPNRTSHEIVINGPLARQYWPSGGGVGETLHIGDPAVTVTVVGITATTRTRSLDREQPTLYVPLDTQHFNGGLTLVARTAIAPELLVRPLIEAARGVDPNVSMISVKTMNERMAVQLWPFRTLSWLFSVCGILALVLASVGLSAVVIHAVNRRLREFGIRVSIGATPGHLVSDVLDSSARLLCPGLIVGILIAALAARLFQAAFVGVNVLNPLTYLAVALVECFIVTVASIGPALRAARVDPLIALRSE